MLTHTGLDIRPGTDLAPSPTDLAVQLARICRFGGAIWWTNLAHSVLVAELAYGMSHMGINRDNAAHLEAWAWGLLHDAHEVVTGDVPNGWKTSDLRKHQDALDIKIKRRYHIEPDKMTLAIVKNADNQAVIVEAIALSLCGYSIPSYAPSLELGKNVVDSIVKAGLNDPAMTRGRENLVIRDMEHVFMMIEVCNVTQAHSVVEHLLYPEKFFPLMPELGTSHVSS
jgi:hypothetical protein